MRMKISVGLVCDQAIEPATYKSPKDYPAKLRRIKYFDAETDNNLVFLTNNFLLPALMIAHLYKCRWQVGLFFKWIKQHLGIKAFYGTSENAVKRQIWIAVSIYVLVAIIFKRLELKQTLCTILQILSVTLFEKERLAQLFANFDYRSYSNFKEQNCNQLTLLCY